MLCKKLLNINIMNVLSISMGITSLGTEFISAADSEKDEVLWQFWNFPIS